MKSTVLTDPDHAALNGRYESGTVSRIDYHREARHLWEAVEIFLTMRCPLRCRHCVTNSHPNRHERMDRDLLIEILRGLAKLKTRFVCLFGGEPELEPGLLRLGIEESRRLGMLPSAVTSGYWAEEESTCRESARLFEGVNALLVSTDQPHMRYVSIETTLRAAEATRSLGINVSICYSALPAEFFGKEELPAELVDGARRIGVGIVVTPISDAGRAAGRSALVTPLDTDVGCGKIDVPLIGCGGDIYACGPGWTIPDEKTSRHRLGSFPETPLDVLRERACGSHVLNTIRNEGPMAMLRAVSETDEELAEELRNDPPVSPCSACQRLSRYLPPEEWWTLDQLVPGDVNLCASKKS